MSSLPLVAWNMKVVSSPSLSLWLGVFSHYVFLCTNSSGYLPCSQLQESHIVPSLSLWLRVSPCCVFSCTNQAQILLDVYHNLRHHRVCRIPWGVCDESLDDGWKKVALGAIRDPSVWCANTRVADNLVLFVSGRSKSSYHTGKYKISAVLKTNPKL